MTDSAARSESERSAELESAMRREDELRSEERGRDAAVDDVRAALLGRLGSLPQLLRVLGSGVLCSAALAFTVQNWGGANDVIRYFYFLGLTGLLAVAGLFCGLRMREDKGARTFLALSAAVVPAHFTVLGALLYSQFAWLSGYAEYPAYAHITAPDLRWALLAAVVGISSLAAITRLAFGALIRPDALRLTGVYLAVNASLLLPTRHPDLIGLLSLALLGGLAWLDRKAWHPTAALRTGEGHLVRAMLLVPPLVLMARSLHLYAFSSLFGAGLLAAVAVLLFELVPTLVESRVVARVAQYAGALAVIEAFGFAADAACAALALPPGSWLLLTSLPAAITLTLLSLRAVDSGAFQRGLAAFVALAGTSLELALFPGVGASLACLATAVAVTGYGFAARARFVFLAGCAAGVWSVAQHLHLALELYSAKPWLSLAAAGVMTVLAASLLERHGRALAGRALAFRERFAALSASAQPLQRSSRVGPAKPRELALGLVVAVLTLGCATWGAGRLVGSVIQSADGRWKSEHVEIQRVTKPRTVAPVPLPPLPARGGEATDIEAQSAQHFWGG